MDSTSAPKFVRKKDGDDAVGGKSRNDALKFANKALRSERSMVDGQLLADFAKFRKKTERERESVCLHVIFSQRYFRY